MDTKQSFNSSDDVMQSLLAAGISEEEIYGNVSTLTNPLETRNRLRAQETTRGAEGGAASPLDELAGDYLTAIGCRELIAAIGGRELTDAIGGRETTAAIGGRETTAAIGGRELTDAIGGRETTATQPADGNERTVEGAESMRADDDDLMLPCEFCNEAIRSSVYMVHALQCAFRNKASGGAGMDCEKLCPHCVNFYPVTLFTEHEMSCDKRPKTQEVEQSQTSDSHEIETPRPKKPKIIRTIPNHEVETRSGSLSNLKKDPIERCVSTDKVFAEESNSSVTSLESRASTENSTGSISQNYSDSEVQSNDSSTGSTVQNYSDAEIASSISHTGSSVQNYSDAASNISHTGSSVQNYSDAASNSSYTGSSVQNYSDVEVGNRASSTESTVQNYSDAKMESNESSTGSTVQNHSYAEVKSNGSCTEPTRDYLNAALPNNQIKVPASMSKRHAHREKYLTEDQKALRSKARFTWRDSNINWNLINREAERRHVEEEEQQQRQAAHQQNLIDNMLKNIVPRASSAHANSFFEQNLASLARLNIQVVNSAAEIELHPSLAANTEKEDLVD